MLKNIFWFLNKMINYMESMTGADLSPIDELSHQVSVQMTSLLQNHCGLQGCHIHTNSDFFLFIK